MRGIAALSFRLVFFLNTNYTLVEIDLIYNEFLNMLFLKIVPIRSMLMHIKRLPIKCVTISFCYILVSTLLE